MDTGCERFQSSDVDYHWGFEIVFWVMGITKGVNL